MVRTTSYECTRPGSSPCPGSQWPTDSTVHPSHFGWLINGYLGTPGEGKLWEHRYHGGNVSRGSGFWASVCSIVKATEMNDEVTRSLAYAPNLPYLYLKIRFVFSFIIFFFYSFQFIVFIYLFISLPLYSSISIIPSKFLCLPACENQSVMYVSVPHASPPHTKERRVNTVDCIQLLTIFLALL